LEKEDGTGVVSYEAADHEHMTHVRMEKVSQIAGDIPPLKVEGPERGELLLLKVNPKAFEPVAKWVTELDYPSWASPVVAHGLMYVRGKDRLVCAELIPEKK